VAGGRTEAAVEAVAVVAVRRWGEMGEAGAALVGTTTKAAGHVQ
jgi:hypothetical protein